MKPSKIHQIKVLTDLGEFIINDLDIEVNKFPILILKDGQRKKLLTVVIHN